MIYKWLVDLGCWLDTPPNHVFTEPPKKGELILIHSVDGSIVSSAEEWYVLA